MATTVKTVGNTQVSGGGGVNAIVTPGTSGNTSTVGRTQVTGSPSRQNAGAKVPTPNSTLNNSSGVQSYSPSGGNAMDPSVRQSMRDAGFDNSRIGWNGSQVTYNGTPVVMPSNVVNGVSTAPREAINTGMNDYLTGSGYGAIRDTLTSRGISDGRIGWQNGQVTIDGQPVYTPEYNINGTTYASMNDINDMTRQAFANSGTPLVAGRDYADMQGYSGLIDWDGSNLTFGGIPIETAYVQDGNAYVTKNDMDRAINQWRDRNRIMTQANVTDAVDERYGNRVDDALNAVLDREAWSFDLENDPVWQSYADQYTRAANEALRSSLNQNNASLSSGTGAVIAQALANRDRYLTDMTNMIPQIFADSYDRYLGETDRLRSNVGTARDVMNDYYDRMYQRQRDTYNDLRDSWQDRNEEEHWQTEDMRAAEAARYANEMTAAEILGQMNENAYQQLYNQYTPRILESEIANTEAQTLGEGYDAQRQMLENAFTWAATTGFFTPDNARALGFREQPDGTFVIPGTTTPANPYYGMEMSARAQSRGSGLGTAEAQYTATQNGWR